MSQIGSSSPHIFQPFGAQDRIQWESKRIFAIGGLPIGTRIEGLTREEAERVLCALTTKEGA